MALALGMGACMPAQGWQRTDRRACTPQSPPVLCLSDAVEGPYEVRVGARVVLPGECIVAPRERGGSVPVELRASGEVVESRRLRLRSATRTDVVVDDEHLDVAQRDRCDGRVDAP